MDMRGAIKQLEETAIVMAGIQARQAEVLKGYGQWLEEHERRMRRLEVTIVEIGDKLNGMIAIMDDMIGRRPDSQ